MEVDKKLKKKLDKMLKGWDKSKIHLENLAPKKELKEEEKEK